MANEEEQEEPPADDHLSKTSKLEEVSETEAPGAAAQGEGKK